VYLVFTKATVTFLSEAFRPKRSSGE